MIQILGKSSAAKQQFVYMIADILALHFGKYEMYTENYYSLSETESDQLSVYSIEQYCGQEDCIIESDSIAIKADHTIYFLTPYQPEIKLFSKFLDSEQAENAIIIYADHIKESFLNNNYLSRMIEEKVGLKNVTFFTIEWDKINKLLCNEGLFDGYFQLLPLSKDYKNALQYVLQTIADISNKDIRRYFKYERRDLK